MSSEQRTIEEQVANLKEGLGIQAAMNDKQIELNNKMIELIKVLTKRLVALEKAHNDLVAAIGLHTILNLPANKGYIEHLASLGVAVPKEAKTQ